jgi:pimeloyl-ACP methyl ester carboxylesterase
MTVHEIELSAGTIQYRDDGEGPAVVLLHGLLMDASLWDQVVADLSRDHRCLAPTLPLGAHRHRMRADADLSLPGIARLVAELLERLDLRGVTLVGNDTGGALVQLLICQGAARTDRVVLASCDAFDNHPPGLTGRALALAGKLPPWLFGAFMQQLRLRPLRRLPVAFRPALVVWAGRDRVMPRAHGLRLAELLPQGRLVEVADSHTLIPLDQPASFAQLVREFTHAFDTSTP